MYGDGSRTKLNSHLLLWPVAILAVGLGLGFIVGAKGFLINYIPEKTIETIAGEAITAGRE